MNIFRFRVTLEDSEEVYRDIELQSSHNFEILHQEILKAFGFTIGEMASFYKSNNNWEKGQEITLINMGLEEEPSFDKAEWEEEGTEGPEPILIMSETTLKQIIKESGQKLIYVYDFLEMWYFYVELLKVDVPKNGVSYPRMINSYGVPPALKKRKSNGGFLLGNETPVTDDLLSDDWNEKDGLDTEYGYDDEDFDLDDDLGEEAFEEDGLDDFRIK